MRFMQHSELTTLPSQRRKRRERRIGPSEHNFIDHCARPKKETQRVLRVFNFRKMYIKEIFSAFMTINRVKVLQKVK